ncbi:MAG: hypothetical protein ACNYPI_10335 [Arenicellales bacterium WSBS_2016_MAG_OTU3]
MGEAIIIQTADDTVWYGSAVAAEQHDRDWLNEHIPSHSTFTINGLINTYTTLILTALSTRTLLGKVSPRID